MRAMGQDLQTLLAGALMIAALLFIYWRKKAHGGGAGARRERALGAIRQDVGGCPRCRPGEALRAGGEDEVSLWPRRTDPLHGARGRSLSSVLGEYLGREGRRASGAEVIDHHPGSSAGTQRLSGEVEIGRHEGRLRGPSRGRRDTTSRRSRVSRGDARVRRGWRYDRAVAPLYEAEDLQPDGRQFRALELAMVRLAVSYAVALEGEGEGDA